MKHCTHPPTAAFVILFTSMIACGEDPRETIPARVAAATVIREIGEADGDQPETQFGRIGAVALDRNGDVYVLDQMARITRRFSADGTYLNSIGQRGAGPGEFTVVSGISIQNDALHILDVVQWRVTEFRTDGTLIGTEEVPPLVDDGWPLSVAPTEDGGWLYLEQNIRTTEDEGVDVDDRIIRGRALLLHRSRGGEWEQVGDFPGMQAGLTRNHELTEAPFPAGPRWATAPDSSYWYADSHTYDVVRITFDGDTLARVRAPIEGAAVSDDDWNAFVAGHEQDPATPIARMRASLPRPERHPAIAQLLTARNGDLWIELESRDEEGRRSWHVYDRDGAPRFRTGLDANVMLRAIYGDTLLTVARDSLDVERVRILKLAPAR